MLAFVADALALVRLRLAPLADVRGNLADLLLGDAVHDDLRLTGHLERDVLGSLHQHRVGEAQLHLKILALERGAVAHAHQLQLLGKAVGHALHHVGDERAHEAMVGLRFARIVRTLDDDFAVLLLDSHDLGERASQLAFRPLHRHRRAVDGHLDAGRNGDGQLADTRHVKPPFPTKYRR